MVWKEFQFQHCSNKQNLRGQLRDKQSPLIMNRFSTKVLNDVGHGHQVDFNCAQLQIIFGGVMAKLHKVGV